ncbi:MAG: zf-HC2 domain-containing protein [Deltaproteobacteria bacterium]|nr:zf-HC2 domain-containing protein [Deltaproteobacteria bacterium]
MNCDDINNAIYVYLDGELAAPEEGDFEGHVSACRRCSRLLAQESGMLTAVRANAPQPKAPESLRLRVLAALDEAPAPLPAEARAQAPRTSAWLVGAGWIGAIAAVVIAMVLAFGKPAGGETDERRVLVESVAAHRENLPMEVRGSEQQVRQYLQENVPFPVEIPFDDSQAIRLTGARLTRVGGREAVLFNYDVQGERMTVVQVATPPEAEAADAETEPSFSNHQGFEVVTFRKRGIINSVVGQGQSPGKIVRASYAQ